jgi:DNA-binding winged helix-turn-helix (wHTH) protein
MYQLHNFPANANAAPHMLLEDTGVKYDLVLVDRAKPRTQPPTWRNGMAELLADIDGLSILVRFLVKDLSAEVQSNDGDFISREADIHSLLSRALEKMVDRMREASLQSGDHPKQPPAIVELISSGEPLVRPQAQPNETVLRVGSLELDLIDRTAKRGDRPIDLRPREFHLLKYMMQRSDQLLTRATLFKDVWHYKFVPETNLVDVHMGRLRRKVDGSNEASMIRNVRGEGFILTAIPSRKVHRRDLLNDQPIQPPEMSLPGQWKDIATTTDNTSRNTGPDGHALRRSGNVRSPTSMPRLG